MMNLRIWATPLTAGAFLLIAATGVLMFFHLDSGMNKTAHEWLGWALLIGVAAHLWLNWRAFSTYFKRPVAIAIMGAGAAALAVSFVLPGAEPVPVRAVLAGLADAPLATVASVAGKEVAVVLAGLATTYPDARAEQSLADLTKGDTEAAIGLVGQVFAKEAVE